MVHKRLQLFTAVLEGYDEADLKQIHKRVVPSCDWIIYHNETPTINSNCNNFHKPGQSSTTAADLQHEGNSCNYMFQHHNSQKQNQEQQNLRVIMWFNVPRAKNFVSRMFNQKTVEALTDASKGPSYWLSRCSIECPASYGESTTGSGASFTSQQRSNVLFQHGDMPDDRDYISSLARLVTEHQHEKSAAGATSSSSSSGGRLPIMPQVDIHDQHHPHHESLLSSLSHTQLLSHFVKASAKARLSREALLKKFPSIMASFPEFVDAVQNHFNPPVTKATFTVFSEPRMVDFQNLVVSGPTGIGKTQYALAHFDSPLRVTNLAQLKLFNPDIHDGIVFDDMQFFHCSTEEQLRIVGWEFDETVYDLIGQTQIATIPAFTRKIFTCDLNRYPFSHDDAITRRLRVNVYYSLFVPNLLE